MSALTFNGLILLGTAGMCAGIYGIYAIIHSPRSSSSFRDVPLVSASLSPIDTARLWIWETKRAGWNPEETTRMLPLIFVEMALARTRSLPAEAKRGGLADAAELCRSEANKERCNDVAYYTALRLAQRLDGLAKENAN